MKAKGTAVKSIPAFVKSNFANRYDEWLNKLPDESRRIMSNPVFANTWYPLNSSIIAPTKILGKMFYNDENKGAFENGIHSADMSLTGIYKIFVRMANPGFVIDRASKIMTTYYAPASMKVARKMSKGVVVHITEFEDLHKVIEYRIAGWTKRALELSPSWHL